MSVILKETMNISINSGEKDAGAVFEGCFKEYLAAVSDDFAEKVLLCIGSERATGDSLGPVTGSMVYEKLGENKLPIYGRLGKTVHAGNIENVLEEINATYKKPLIIAVDAALSKRPESVGFINMGYGPLCPGSYSGKKLMPVGDIFITGVVNWSPMLKNIEILQSTQLGKVVKMAEIISAGIAGGLRASP